jgi:two-component system, cell cycle response regulator DivK
MPDATRVLIVEDNAINLALSTFLVHSAGYAVLAAATAEEGIRVAREQSPGLILMDIQLPGMDGLEAIGLLKRDPVTNGIPIIALTALAMKGDEARIRASGCEGYIAKPMRYKEFLAAVALVLAPA